MKPFPKVLLLIPLIWGAFFVATGFFVYRALIAPGFIWVDVEDRVDGVHIALPLPAVFLNAAIDIAGVAQVRLDFDEMNREVAEVAPLIGLFVSELEKYPDITLVEIEGPDERVRIGKKKGALKVEVIDDEARVRVSIPVRTLQRFARFAEL